MSIHLSLSQKLVECHIKVQHKLGFQSSHQISQASHLILGLSSKLKFSRILGLGFSEMTKNIQDFAVISYVDEGRG